MSSQVTDQQAQSLLALLHTNKDAEVKAAEVQKIKAQIKHNIVQTEAIPILFDALRIGLASTNANLFAHAFSCIGHLIKRVQLQDPNRLRVQCQHLLPIFTEKLGDQKPRNSSLAVTCLIDMHKACPQDTERAIKDLAMGSKNPRIREGSIVWLRQVFSTVPGFSFRSFTPFLMKMLEDADAAVRESTKEIVVELFKNAPDHAKADLKKELARHGVRKAIATYIISQLGIPGGESENKAAEDEPALVTKGGKAASVAGNMASASFLATMPGTELESLEPEYVNTNRELEEIFQSMAMSFDGRESEQNWLAREKNCLKIRRMLRGNAYKDYQQSFLVGVKGLLDGILKAVNSLRTTLSNMGCQLVKDLAIICGPGIDPMVEILLINTIKSCANTKKITAQMGNVTTAVLVSHVSYHQKILQHIFGAVQDKNVQPRLFATGWLRLILETHADHKGYLEHTGGLDILEKCIKRGLADANPGVREGMRGIFWKFAALWPDRASVIMDGLDNIMKKLLEKENPNAGAASKGVSTFKAPALNRAATAPTARPSVKEAILAQKRKQQEMAAKLQRADSFPPEPAPVPAPQPATQPSGLSSAPVRPTRPKIRPVPEQPSRSTPAASSAASLTANRAVSPSTTHSSSKETPVHLTRKSPVPSSPPQSLRVTRTPMRQQTPQAASRKLTVLEQLSHQDWRIRVEGIVAIACILAKKIPPNYDGVKTPTLPPADVLGPALQKLLNDSQPEVVEHVLAPEVLSELYKVVPLEQIATKVLLLSEDDDEDHSQPIRRSTMPALKGLITQGESATLLFTVMTNMGAFGTVARTKTPTNSYTPTQKKRIIHGCLVWLIELVNLALEGHENECLQDNNTYKTYVNRLLSMLSHTKPPNYFQLAKLLKGFRKLDSQNFDKILSTFESQTVKDLKRAWGQPIEEEEQPVMEERVAHVQEVLGEVPVIPKVRHMSPGPTSPRLRKRDFSPTQIKRDFSGRSVSGPAPPVPRTPPHQRSRSASEDKENKDSDPRTPERKVVPAELTQRATAALKAPTSPTVVESNGALASAGRPQSGEWTRVKVTKQVTNSQLPNTPEKTAHLLNTLIQRVRARDIDAQSLRKLMSIVRENPVKGVLQENNGETMVDIWNGGKVFDELLTILLGFLADDSLAPDRAAELRVQGLLVLKQLLNKTAPYLSRHEAAVLTTLINLRGKYPTQSHVTTGIEEISEEFMQAVDSIASIDAIINVILPILPENDVTPVVSEFLPTQSWCMGLKCLAQLIKNSDKEGLEKDLTRLAKLAKKSLDAADAEVRKSAVNLCVDLHGKLGMETRVFFEEVLTGLTAGHQNLLTYYFAKGSRGL